MKLELLFENFELLAYAPNGIQKLRDIILQLAVQGKLVQQYPDDEPASVLLEKIKAEREELAKEKNIRLVKVPPPIKTDEFPNGLPDSWVWARLGEISYQITDGTHFTPKYIDNGVPFLSVKDISQGFLDFSNTRFISEEKHKELIKRCKPEPEDILICRIGTLGKPVLVNVSEPFSIFVSVGLVKFVTKFIYPKFLLTTLNSPLLVQQYDDIKAGGSHANKLNLRDMPFLKIPIPPLKEQKRIVAKVDQLMDLCAELEARNQKRNKTRVALNDASLDNLLGAKSTIKFKKHWQRIVNNFNLLYDNPENVNKLRQAILQLAVQGKLVPQDLKDESADLLLKMIASDKEHKLKEGKFNKLKPLPHDEISDVPFKLSRLWSWTLLDAISYTVHYGYTASANNDLTNVRLLRISDIQNNKVNWDSVPGCEINEKKLRANILNNGDILIARTGGTIGKTFLIEKHPVTAVFASYLIRVVPSPYMSPRYLKIFLESPLYWEQLYQKTTGTGQPNVNATSLRGLKLPVPPLKEQKRVVAKVDQLMALCDELEAKLSKSQSDCDKLLSIFANCAINRMRKSKPN
jgi:type I restriction enzyme S subunit